MTSQTAQVTAASRAWFAQGYRESFSQWWNNRNPREAETQLLQFVPYIQHTNVTTPPKPQNTSWFHRAPPTASPAANTSQSSLPNTNKNNGDPYGARTWQATMVDLSGKDRSINEFSIDRANETPEENLVMLHGYGAGLGYFYRNFEPLSRLAGWKLYALDLLGMGNSSRPPFTLHAKDERGRVFEAEDWFTSSLEEWRIKRNLDQFTLMGHSLGGYIALAYALKYPGRLKKLILVSPVGVPGDKPPDDHAQIESSVQAEVTLDQESIVHGQGLSRTFSRTSASGETHTNKSIKNDFNNNTVAPQDETAKKDEENTPGFNSSFPLLKVLRNNKEQQQKQQQQQQQQSSTNSSSPPSAPSSAPSSTDATTPRPSSEAPQKRQLPRWFATLWDMNFSPMSIVRFAGPLGPRIISAWSYRRFNHLSQTELDALHYYSYSVWCQRGSSEYCILPLMYPGAYARRPMIHRIDNLGHQRIPHLSANGKDVYETGLPVVFMYGDHDWMDISGAYQAEVKLGEARERILLHGTDDQKKKERGSVRTIVLPNAGHHLYLDNPDEFNRIIHEELRSLQKEKFSY